MSKVSRNRSDQAREVAEIFISNSADYSSHSLTRYHAINTMPNYSYDSLYHNEDYLREMLAAGSPRDGRISAVRRFFCLFITFDFLFTTLMWLICIVISGENIKEMLINEIVHYTIHESLFDIVMASAGRFVILLLFYALLCINHWWVIAITTAGSCGFLITKVFFFEWAKATNYTLDVFLVLSSFVLSWGEAWFLDFRVLPQESLARDFFGAISSDGERQPLLQNQATSVRSHNLDDFYSPIDSPQDSDDDQPNRANRSSVEDDELARKALESFEEALSTINSDGWKIEKQTPEGDVVHSKFIRRNHKIFRITGTVDIPPKLLFDELDRNIENVPSWNPTLLECRTLKTVNEKVSISYQLAAEGGGGIISSRDFINLRYCEVRDGVYICAGTSIVFPEMPAQKGYVRGENGPGCWVMTPIPNEPNKCVFQWLLDTNLKGWIPQSIIDTALSFAMCDYLRYVRNFAESLRKEGKF
ncbi:hypothetical protein GHT06_008369 [Daphnia sinensis]|uniref:Uncharacterized protein n=1 Tax=Daphnia sinensis TaxID=1820382 RepID=A0AAD5Q0L5_9CRUS|nr:hypothetical protein GHT06_008369 [Daphnia sinensis]